MSDNYKVSASVQEQPKLMVILGSTAILGCVIFCVSILIADFVVPNHDWVADTISDLGAGKYEFIVDIGIYAFSGSLVCVALLMSHVHLGAWPWSAGIAGFAVMGLIVFLVGARNEYGDTDSDGLVIHIYLVYVIGALMTVLPLAVLGGMKRVGALYGTILPALSGLWTLSAPIFFFLPDSIDGIYERYLGLIAMGFVVLLARFFINRGVELSQDNSA